MPNSSVTGRTLLRAPFIEDVPRAYRYTLLNQKSRLYGPYAQTIWTFAKYHNLELELDFFDDYKAREIHQSVQNGFYNLSLYGSAYISNGTQLQSSYPLERLKYCVMVPLEDELPKFWYVVWPFGRYIWITLFFAVIYIAILLRFLENSTRNTNRSLVHNLLHSIALIFYSPNFSISLQNRPIRVMIFYTFLFALGFILSAFHQSHMTSYCMKPVFVPPLDTVADIKNANLKVLISENIFEELLENSYGHLLSLGSHLHNVTWQEFQSTLEGLNRSVGYVVPQDKWKFILKQQRNLKQPFFHISQICIGGGFTSYPLHRNQELFESLKAHILAVQAAGLWNFWEEQAFDVAVLAKYAKILLDSYDVLPLNLEFFKIGWIVLGVGLLLSCCAIVGECISIKRKKPSF